MATSCWDSPTALAALTRNPARYVRLAQAILDAVPESWERVTAHLVIASSGVERCEIRAACGDPTPAPKDCRGVVRKALAELGAGALLPSRALWIGIWVDYDIDADRLTATIMHGGQIPEPARTHMEVLASSPEPKTHAIMMS